MTKLQILNFNDKGYISSEKAKKVLGALESQQEEAGSDNFLLILQDLILEEWEQARILFLLSFNRYKQLTLSCRWKIFANGFLYWRKLTALF